LGCLRRFCWPISPPGTGSRFGMMRPITSDRPCSRGKAWEKIWFQPGATQQFYPLTYSVFWLEQKLWADATPGYHLVNILLHAASALLLVKVLRRLEVPGAWLAGALWALHPVQAESVAWMSELKNTLSGLCYLGSALAYLRFDRERKGAFYLVSLGCLGRGCWPSR